MHARTHAHTYVHTHTHVRARIRARAHARTQVQPRTHLHTYTSQCLETMVPLLISNQRWHSQKVSDYHNITILVPTLVLPRPRNKPLYLWQGIVKLYEAILPYLYYQGPEINPYIYGKALYSCIRHCIALLYYCTQSNPAIKHLTWPG